MTLFRTRYISRSDRKVIEMYSVREVAAKLGVSERRVRVLLSEGRIEGKKLGRDWVVLSLDYKRKRRPKGGVGRMTKLKVTMELDLGVGKKPATTKEEELLVELLV